MKDVRMLGLGMQWDLLEPGAVCLTHIETQRKVIIHNQDNKLTLEHVYDALMTLDMFAMERL